MKTTRVALAYSFVIAMVAATCGQAQNLIQNGDFATSDTTGWDSVAGFTEPTVTSSTTPGAPNQSATAYYASSTSPYYLASTANGGPYAISQTVSGVINGVYDFQFLYNVHGQDDSTVSASISDSDAVISQGSTPVVNPVWSKTYAGSDESSGWETVDLTLDISGIVGSSDATVTFNFNTGTGGTLAQNDYLDDVSFLWTDDLPQPQGGQSAPDNGSTLVLLGGSLGLLAALEALRARRRRARVTIN